MSTEAFIAIKEYRINRADISRYYVTSAPSGHSIVVVYRSDRSCHVISFSPSPSGKIERDAALARLDKFCGITK